MCTTTTSIVVNGSPTYVFPFKKGLRQVDHLSPFLFLLEAERLNVMMSVMVWSNLFIGYRTGSVNSTVISHVQFADDMLLLGVKIWANVWAFRVVLVLFEAMFGLKVNFNKSMLVEVNIVDYWLVEATSDLRGSMGKVPFLYLGLLIGGDPRHLSFWDPVLTRI